MDTIIGQSNWARQTRQRIGKVAGYGSSVLITGPSGTGKELIARAIHRHSSRSKKPFVTVDCASIPGSLFASQLFGHVRGAFTGADYTALGFFRAADGGTIFLDEVGELDAELQVRLLRVIQERVVVPVGSHQGTRVDVRIVAATNRDLRQDVASGRFRLDLYYRLNVLSFETRPLRERVADIEPLVRHFLAKMSVEGGLPLKQLSPGALAGMQSYDWPGNVRELQNVLERAVIFAEGDIIEPEAVPPIAETGTPALDTSPSDSFRPASAAGSLSCFDHGETDGLGDDASWPTLDDVVCEHIRATLERTQFNQSEAARLLGTDRRRVARKIRKYGIPIARFGRQHRLPREAPSGDSPD